MPAISSLLFVLGCRLTSAEQEDLKKAKFPDLVATPNGEKLARAIISSMMVGLFVVV